MPAPSAGSPPRSGWANAPTAGSGAPSSRRSRRRRRNTASPRKGFPCRSRFSWPTCRIAPRSAPGAGSGNSTALLQVASGLAREGRPVLYVSGEESEAQVKLRASRLGVRGEGIFLMAETSVERVIAATSELSPFVLIVDSIQTMFASDLPGAPGSVGQVRECAGRLVFYGKKAGVSVFLVGHVTKEGTIAGPRVLEHLVDTVLYFEGEKGHPYRILKAVKNRFGSTNEIGVFEMRAEGLTEVADPSGMFLSERSGETSGTLVFPAIEGTRPLLVEVQALVSQSFLAMPRRTTLGVDYNRVILMNDWETS